MSSSEYHSRPRSPPPGHHYPPRRDYQSRPPEQVLRDRQKVRVQIHTNEWLAGIVLGTIQFVGKLMSWGYVVEYESRSADKRVVQTFWYGDVVAD